MELLLQACMTILGLIASQFDGAQQLENGATSAQHTMPQREDMGRLRSARLRLTVASMRMTQGAAGRSMLRGPQRCAEATQRALVHPSFKQELPEPRRAETG